MNKSQPNWKGFNGCSSRLSIAFRAKQHGTDEEVLPGLVSAIETLIESGLNLELLSIDTAGHGAKLGRDLRRAVAEIDLPEIKVSTSARLPAAFHADVAHAESSISHPLAGRDIKTENGVAAIARAVFNYLTGEARRVQSQNDVLKVATAVDVDKAVDGASFIGDTNAEAVANIPGHGILTHNGKHFLVDMNGQRVYSLDSLCMHDVVSPLDLAWFESVAETLGVLLKQSQAHALA